MSKDNTTDRLSSFYQRELEKLERTACEIAKANAERRIQQQQEEMPVEAAAVEPANSLVGDGNICVENKSCNLSVEVST